MSDLKLCPFCGGEATWAKGSRGWKVECEGRMGSCTMNARTHYQPDKYRAITAWNTRAAPKVKPLEWEGDNDAAWVETPIGEYRAFVTGGGWQWSRHGYYGSNYFGSMQAAKAEAQADYERRILSALTPETET